MIVLGLLLQLAAPINSDSGAAGSPGNSPAMPRLYTRASYGSQSVFSPLSVILNKGFDHFQSRNASRDLWRFPFATASQVPLDALRHPARAIERYPGWNKWLRTEVLPMGFSSEDARWAVNYSEHLMAGGLTYRMLAEWFESRRYPAPRVWAGVTTFGASFLNEAAEFAGGGTAVGSTVADLYVFDLGGILLFSFDWPVRLFGGTLQAADWSTQASLMFPNGELQNNGQYYIMKIPLPKTRTRLFARFGMGLQGGVSQPIGDGGSISVSMGADTEVRNVDPVTKDETIVMRPAGGIFWDRHNSLLASLVAGPTDNRVVLNVYPGVLAGMAGDLGFWAAQTRHGPQFGLVHRRVLGLGFCYAR